ncbi:N-6 DNA methylase [Methylosinus sporium]|uniref:site-specific DNA-methyltransferase (adenine-specific) n=1 Tax=Methylosinus sporium TaxID=428 RepID=A0A549T6T5_METSR|nr:N-6 DNA methylase [Methylosinus sporium]TRL37593.1 N-6 DNA methylase [Methylosinus sporium]
MSRQKTKPSAVVAQATDLARAERPTIRADHAGAAYSEKVSVDHRKEHGLYLTPVPVADFMAEQITATSDTIRILDPAAGAGILLCAVVEELLSRRQTPRRIELVAYEVDKDLAEVLGRVLHDLQEWAAAKGTVVAVELVPEDFILTHAAALQSMGGFFPHLQPEHAFDVVIANPPYFKLNKADPRAQAAAAVVHGQPNIYGLFMAVGAALLHDGGELVYIVPRSFASGPYFWLFREKFFGCIRPEFAHVFGSRRDAFNRDAVLQENIILKGIRQDGWLRQRVRGLLTISTSQGVGDLDAPERRTVSLDSVLNMKSADKVLRLPVSTAEDALLRLVDGWSGSLRSYGLQISTGPVVPFRATEFLDKAGSVPDSHAPLLWMNHVLAMKVTWPIGRHKPEYIKRVMASQGLLVPNRNYVLMRRFSAKEEARRLVAGPYLARAVETPVVGLENHLNYIYRPNGTLTEDETFGLAALFSSSLLDTYFRACNGNTQVSATELRAMPLPPLDIIKAIGREARALQNSPEAIDSLVIRLVGKIDQNEKVPAVG